jgi:hypothetical protein
MKMLFSNKRGQANDITYIIVIFGLLFIVAVILPFLQRDLISGSDYGTGIGTEINENNPYVINASKVDVNTASSIISMGTIIVSVGKMLFWYYGTLPLGLELFFVFIKIIGWLLIYRQIRSGGG